MSYFKKELEGELGTTSGLNDSYPLSMHDVFVSRISLMEAGIACFSHEKHDMDLDMGKKITKKMVEGLEKLDNKFFQSMGGG